MLSKKQVIEELGPLTNVLYERFPQASRIVTPYFRDRGLDINHPTASEMLRFEMKRLLTISGIQVEDEQRDEDVSVDSFAMYDLARNGLSGAYAGYAFRIWKSSFGELPTPGPSLAKQAFYGQQMSLLPGPDPQNVRPNVAILWRANVNYSAFDLFVSVPKAGGRTRASVEAYFTEPVPDPITLITRLDDEQVGEPVSEAEFTSQSEQPEKTTDDLRRTDKTGPRD